MVEQDTSNILIQVQILDKNNLLCLQYIVNFDLIWLFIPPFFYTLIIDNFFLIYLSFIKLFLTYIFLFFSLNI